MRLHKTLSLLLVTMLANQSFAGPEFDREKFAARSEEAKKSCSFFHDRAFEAPEKVILAEVLTKAPLYDVSHISECKDSEITNCRIKETVNPHELVILINTDEDFSCIMLTRKSYRGAGVISSGALKRIQASDSDAASWTGDWDGPASIKITKENEKLKITGNAIWHGINSEHYGELNFQGVPDQNKLLHLSNGNHSCDVIMLLDKETLVVIDRHCGGTNVSFTGLYTRKQ